ncbi:hypothetical protein DAEQUDRAFT_772994 [Daedalea quercina L-15889]|uniref:BTB domain-containing protein n=1 Tax=Daedalea quercina L-15889 TaxID=1314783 RepID=A0A165SQF0_9APHY|nr:hypothetical protein DAEQUDRAFT_772994 [Daedalea quercina L-15889]
MAAPAHIDDHAPFIPDKEVWFSDGNVVLEAEGRAFKVYQGLLARDSEVFRDLFTIPQPSSMEVFDGCPVVHLTDHPQELRHLLRVIFDGKRYYRPDEQVEFAIVAALIRLSHKYEIDYVRDDYLARMKSCFGTDPGDWDTVSHDSGSPRMNFNETDAIALVNIARLTGTDTILPLGLYLCCQLDAKYLLNGYRRPEGSLEWLDSEDLARCIDARQSLLQKSLISVLQVYDPSTIFPSCTHHFGTRGDCRRTIESMRQKRMERSPTSLLQNYLKSDVSMIRSLQKANLLCQNCADMLCRAGQQRYRANWIILPQLLDLEAPAGWPEE